MILPYRTKNPPEHFPIVTIILIVLNILIYLLTSSQNTFLRIDDNALEQYAVSHNSLSLFRLTSAMFLHANLEHIAGNMLFLWLFGAAAEGRLRPLKFIILYFLAGWTGGLLSDLLLGAVNPDAPSLGASGAIMGVAGSYLFMFPYSIIRVAYGFQFRWGVADWRAWWVVVLYVGMDILFGVVFRTADGVGHYAHLGGFGTGLLVTWLMRAHRDSEEASEARAVIADTKDYTALNYHELEALLQKPTDNMHIVLAFCEKAARIPTPERQELCVRYLNYYAAKLITESNPEQLASILLTLPPTAGGLPLVYYLRLGSRLEAISSNDYAVQIYRRIYDLAPYTPDTEMALYRTAQIMLKAFGNRAYAQATYQEMLRLFPHGDMALDAQRELQRII